MRRHSERPSSSGRWRSTSATSGRVSAIASKPSRAVAAVAATRRSVLVLDQPAEPGTNGGVIVDEHDVHHDSVAAAPVRSIRAAPQLRAGLHPYGSTRPRRIA